MRPSFPDPLVLFNPDGSTHLHCPLCSCSLMRLRLRGRYFYVCPLKPNEHWNDKCPYELDGKRAWAAKNRALATRQV